MSLPHFFCLPRFVATRGPCDTQALDDRPYESAATKTENDEHGYQNFTTFTWRVMPSSTIRFSVRSHVPVADLLTSPLLESTAYSGAPPPSSPQISLRVTQPPRLLPPDSTYRFFEPEEYRIDTLALELHFGLEMALFGEAVFAAAVGVIDRRLATAAVRRSIVVFSIVGWVTVILSLRYTWWYGYFLRLCG